MDARSSRGKVGAQAAWMEGGRDRQRRPRRRWRRGHTCEVGREGEDLGGAPQEEECLDRVPCHNHTLSSHRGGQHPVS